MCVLFSSSFNRTSESRKCVRHEIRPGYLLSHALASRLPSSSTEPPLSRAGYTTGTHTTCSRHACSRQECVSVWLLSSVPHQQVNIFTQSTCLNESRGRRRKHFSFFCVQTTFNIESKANSELFLPHFAGKSRKEELILNLFEVFQEFSRDGRSC